MPKKIEELSSTQQSMINGILENRITQIENVIASKTESVSTAPDGSLRISKSHGITQYYHKSVNGKKAGDYIPKTDGYLPKSLAQKEYDVSLLKELNKEHEYLLKVLKKCSSFNTDKIYEKLNNDRKKLVTPVSYSDQEYINIWKSIESSPKSDDKSFYDFVSLNGEKVKTASEKMIADALFNAGIPYKYEYPLVLEPNTQNKNIKRSGGLLSVINSIFTVHCTFYCLNVRTRQEYIWEVFNNIDDQKNLEESVKKISDYNNSGFILGKNLIYLLETSSNPLTDKLITNTIEAHLK